MADDARLTVDPDGLGGEESLARVSESLSLVEAAQRTGVTLRLLGGVAVFLHCRESDAAAPHRLIRDIDAAIPPSQGKLLEAALAERGYTGEARFNALHGDTRLIFSGPAGKLDVFVGTFAMCHSWPLGPRLQLDSPTIPVTDLLLTKLQVVHLTQQDVQDLALLLHRHDIGDGRDEIDAQYLAGLCSADWGLWRSSMASLDHVLDINPALAEKVSVLRSTLDAAPKTRRFKMRARVGDRVPWFEIPGEVA